MDPIFEESVIFRTLDIFQSLHAESDRGCVLVVSAMLELSIEKQLLKRLFGNPSREDGLIGNSSDKPISDFSSKINLSYHVGLLPLHELKMFHQLRKLRNHCAHEIGKKSFDDNHFKNIIGNIINESNDVWETLRESIGPKLFESNPPTTIAAFVHMLGWRTAFELFFSMVISFKELYLDRVIQITPLYETNMSN